MRLLPSPLLPLLLLPTTISALPSKSHNAVPRDIPASLPHITSLQYSGNGCPSSAPGIEKGGAWNDASFRMNAFDVSIPGSASESTKNCEVHMQASGAAPGWQVGVKDVYVKGHLVLDPGVKMDFFVQVFWSDHAGDTVTVRGSLTNNASGRMDQVATAHASIPDSSVVWSRCTGSGGDIGILNVNFRTALQADGNQHGYFGKGGDVAATESWDYVWRRC